MTPGGLPHSGTRGSTPADGSPRLVAAFRALHRPSTPRHPPCARRSSAIALAHDAEPTGSTHVTTTLHLSTNRDPRGPRPNRTAPPQGNPVRLAPTPHPRPPTGSTRRTPTRRIKKRPARPPTHSHVPSRSNTILELYFR